MAYGAYVASVLPKDAFTGGLEAIAEIPRTSSDGR
jgi:hypothetical protein